MKALRWFKAHKTAKVEKTVCMINASKIQTIPQRRQCCNSVHCTSTMENGKISVGTIYSSRIVSMTREMYGYLLKADPFQGEDMLSANNHVISASHESEKHKEVLLGL